MKAFDKIELENYKTKAKERWGKTDAYSQYEQKASNYTAESEKALATDLMQVFVEIGKLKDLPADAPAVQAKITELQNFITEHYYTCTNEILAGLGKMYVGDDRFKQNIDRAATTGTAEFAAKAIEHYCKSDN